MQSIIIFMIYSVILLCTLFVSISSGNYSWWQIVVGSVGLASCLWFANSSAIDYDKRMQDKVRELEDKISIMTEHKDNGSHSEQ